MMVRCGRCRNQFDVSGPGRFACPVCGVVNEVRAAATPEGMVTPPVAPPPPTSPSPRVSCPACDFSFIVGDIDAAPCPNCGAEVPVGQQARDRQAAS
ncbi:MAG: hypothetical protein M3N51_01490 [Actinomycetota bacterium]|nr:hypothetical protein [Actinomycetota bacterium]